MSFQNQFENKLRLHRRRKEIIVFLLIASIILSIIFFYNFVKYSPLFSSKYPKINILCQEKPNINNEVDCEFELISENPKYSISQTKAKIITRGSSPGSGADRWPKKSYRISLSQQRSLLGMREDDDWLLFSMYIDFPRLRIKMGFDLWNSLEDENPTAISVKSEYVLLYINREFQGLYLLSEKNDRKLFGLDDAQNNIYSSLIFQIKYSNYLTGYERDNWEQDWPNEDDGIYIMDEIMAELIDFINNSNNEEFFDSINGIYSKFDKLNLIDFYLFNYFIIHEDFWNKNYFIIRNSNPSLFYLFPWDYDFSMGQWISNLYEADDNPEDEIRRLNHLYNRLLDNEEFRKSCKERWIYLRENLWTEEFILELLSKNYEEIREILEIETEMWNPVGLHEKWDNDVDKYVNHLYEWFPERLEFCDYYFGSHLNDSK